MRCEHCEGKGRIECPECDGKGTIEDKRESIDFGCGCQAVKQNDGEWIMEVFCEDHDPTIEDSD